MNVAVLDIDAQHLPVRTEFVFDSSNPNWTGNPDHNFFFLTATQNMFNDRLLHFGHVFLNEILDQLEIPRTKFGQVAGWIRFETPGFIDFGLYVSEDGKVITLNFNAMSFILDALGA